MPVFFAPGMPLSCDSPRPEKLPALLGLLHTLPPLAPSNLKVWSRLRHVINSKIKSCVYRFDFQMPSYYSGKGIRTQAT